MTSTQTDDGGKIARSKHPYSCEIKVATESRQFVTIGQHHDEVQISEAQLLGVMEAIRRAAKHLGWQSFLEGER